MRYELNDYEWTAIKPMLPNKPRDVQRDTVACSMASFGYYVRVRRGAICPKTMGPIHDLLQSLRAWRHAGIWDKIMEAMTAAHDGTVQMIDTSVVRVHQHGACVAGNREQHMGRSRGGLTSNIHTVVDANGLPAQLGLTPGEAHDNRLCRSY